MSSSMQNKCYNMLFMLIVFMLFSTIRTDSARNFVELPLQIDAASSTIHATLTDIYDDKKYNLDEFISNSGSVIKGKIGVSGEEDHYNIHYALNHDGVDSRERLVDHETQCLLLIFTFKSTWSEGELWSYQTTLPGIKKPLLSSLLLMGPSISYRISHSSVFWNKVDDKNIRGVMMKGAQTEINKRLKITYYYKNNFDDQSGLRNPSRIVFNGTPPEYDSGSIESLILDIHSRNEDRIDELQYKVQPSPGIQCPHYLSGIKNFPKLKSNYAHFTMQEYSPDSPMTRTINEIYASASAQTLRIKKLLLGKTSETFYDYNTGIRVIIDTNRSCSVSLLDESTPGASIYGYLSLKKLFLSDNSVYIGKTNLKQKPGLPVETWESVSLDTYINGKKVDKAVIEHYFVESPNDVLFDNYTLISTIISIYKQTGSFVFEKYSLVDRIVRDYSNFQKAGAEAEIHDMIKISDCIPLISNKTLTLNFKIICDEESAKYFFYGDCIKFIEGHIYKLKEEFLDLLANKISPLRIKDIQNDFTDSQLDIEITFFDKLEIKKIFIPKIMFVSSDTIEKIESSIGFEKIKASNEYECLNKISQSRFYRSVHIVVYRPSDSFCGFIEKPEDLKEDVKSGQQCSVFHINYTQLLTIAKEPSLDQIHDYLLREFRDTFSMTFEDVFKAYRVADITDVTQNKDTIFDYSYRQISLKSKFKRDDEHTKTVLDANNFADCYRACHSSELLPCNTFSFCKTEDSVDCKVSDLSTSELDEETHFEKDEKCSIMALNILDYYSEASNRKFKLQLSTAIEKRLDDCAELCHSSPDCLSFDYCGDSCSFGGFYTDSVTKYDEDCKVFYPKLSTKYQNTGNKIVSEVIYTEINLNLDQCAALCDGWSDGDTGCKSFNYCPKSKTESSCSLTKFSVKDSDNKTTDGGDCSNYELKIESSGKRNKESSSAKVTNGTSAFGIVLAFLLVGSLLGFVTPFIYSRVRQISDTSINYESFSWTKSDIQSEVTIEF